LVDFVNIDKKKIIKKKSPSETTNSIADLKKLKKNIGELKFKSLENYLRTRLKLSDKKKIISTKFDYPKTKYEGSVIYGAGFAGKKLFEKLKQQKEKIIFFVDDDPKKHDTLFNNIPVISFDNLRQINKRKIIDKILLLYPH
jgi:FlaA1/EpsC-like NDP-sugar epimerase